MDEKTGETPASGGEEQPKPKQRDTTKKAKKADWKAELKEANDHGGLPQAILVLQRLLATPE